MNAQVAHAPLEADAPYRFTYAEALRMAEAGVFDRDDGWGVELIEGELIAVAPQSLPHVAWKIWFTQRLMLALADQGWTVVPDSPLVANARSGPEPDVYVFPSRVALKAMTPPDVALAIEIAQSSQDMDLKRKPGLYARYGIQEYWVADVPERRIVVHRAGDGARYTDVRAYGAGERVAPLAFPEVVVAIDDLPVVD
jgi:Uma2 family endonuclease